MGPFHLKGPCSVSIMKEVWKNYRLISRFIGIADAVLALYKCLMMEFVVGPVLAFGAWKLIKSTEQGILPAKCLQGCRIWRAIIAFCIVWKLALTIAIVWIDLLFAIFAITFCLFHIWALYIVKYYMTQKSSELAFQQALEIV